MNFNDDNFKTTKTHIKEREIDDITNMEDNEYLSDVSEDSEIPVKKVKKSKKENTEEKSSDDNKTKFDKEVLFTLKQIVKQDEQDEPKFEKLYKKIQQKITVENMGQTAEFKAYKLQKMIAIQFAKTPTGQMIRNCIFKLSGFYAIVTSNRDMKVVPTTIFKESYFSMFSIHCQYYLKHLTIYNLVIKKERKMIMHDDEELNLRKQMRFEFNEPKKVLADEIKQFRDFLLIQVCNNNKEAFYIFEKWISCLFAGRKTQLGMMIKSTTGGTFKSKIGKILLEILGEASTLTKPSDFERFNQMTLGRFLAVLEELPTEKHESKHLVQELKKIITENTYCYESKGKDSQQLACLENVLILTNNPLPYFERKIMRITPLSTLTKIDAKLGGEVEKIINSSAYLENIFWYYNNLDDGKWNGQIDAERIDDYISSCEGMIDLKGDKTVNSFKFIVHALKSEILQGKLKKTALYEQFEKFCKKNHFFATEKGEFYAQIGELGLTTRKSDGYYIYDFTPECVADLSAELKCRYLLDDNSIAEAKMRRDEEFNENFDETFPKGDDREKDYEIKRLKEEIAELRRLLTQRNEKPISETKVAKTQIIENDDPIIFKSKFKQIMKEHKLPI